MEMYENITRIMELTGWTFDETLTYVVLILVGCVGGFSFMLSLFSDLGRCLYRAVKDLLRFIIRRIRHRARTEP